MPSYVYTKPGGNVVGGARFAQIVGAIAKEFERIRVSGKDGRISPIGIRTVKRAAVVGTLVRDYQNESGEKLRTSPGVSELS